MLKGVSQIQASHLWLDCWMKVASKTSVSLPGLCQCCHRQGTNFLFCRASCQILLGLVEARSTENPWKPQSALAHFARYFGRSKSRQVLQRNPWKSGLVILQTIISCLLEKRCWWPVILKRDVETIASAQCSSKTSPANNPDCKLSQTPHCSCSSLFCLDQTNLWRNAALSAVLEDAKSRAPLLRTILLVRMWGRIFPDMILCTPENLMPGTDGMWRSGWTVGLYKECSSRVAYEASALFNPSSYWFSSVGSEPNTGKMRDSLFPTSRRTCSVYISVYLTRTTL